jgi:hypothetical protein
MTSTLQEEVRHTCWICSWPRKTKKNMDSFLFATLYHISALQSEGLWIWDASTQSHIPQSIPFIFVTADGPAMAMVLGMVRHSGKFGC